MEFLTDENIKTEWVQALRTLGHPTRRVVDVPELGLRSSDHDILDFASRNSMVLLTVDRTDFTVPPVGAHGGILLVSDRTMTGSDIQGAVTRLEVAYPDLTDQVVFLSDWV